MDQQTEQGGSPARVRSDGAALIEACGEITVINLPYRADRRIEFDAQLARIGLGLDHPGVHLFAAIRPDAAGDFPSIGARGCFLSHLGALRAARDQGVDRLLICEDDMDFASDLPERLAGISAEILAQPWDILYGFAPENLLAATGGKGSVTGLIPVPHDIGITCAHFVAFRRPVIEGLVPYLEAMLARPPGDPAGGPMHVDGAYGWYRHDNPQLRVLAAHPAIGMQRSSRTDIAELGLKDRLPVIRDLVQVARKWRNARRG